jgi:hypothetical protein
MPQRYLCPLQRHPRRTCIYEDRRRELCPHIIGTNRSGEAVVLAWQFGGKSSGKLPQWRCLRLAKVSDFSARSGGQHVGGSHRSEQSCVSKIDLDINIHMRKRGRRFDPTGKSPRPCSPSDLQMSSPAHKKISVFRKSKSSYMICHPVPERGALAIVTNVGTGSGGRGSNTVRAQV